MSVAPVTVASTTAVTLSVAPSVRYETVPASLEVTPVLSFRPTEGNVAVALERVSERAAARV